MILRWGPDQRYPSTHYSNKVNANIIIYNHKQFSFRWGPDQRYPSAHYVRTIGPVGNKDAESDAILFEHDVPTRPFSVQSDAILFEHDEPTRPFSAQVRVCLPRQGWRIPDDEIAKRLVAGFRNIAFMAHKSGRSNYPLRMAEYIT
ncbi:hypothetical protein T492DRAFT_845198 [Pavlovales sp. CCMP2436]|nr:hypothetical protein T492DRAFT_845198 [Pavlovales sp. CCMP2436]